MAKKRMFRLDVLETDAFMDMPLTTQALYFHLNLRADDDGFVGNPKRIVHSIGANIDDLNLLIAKRFVLTFEDGVIVIKHWRLHNNLTAFRYQETQYIEDKSMLRIKDNSAYSFEHGNLIDDSHYVEVGKRQSKDETKTRQRRDKDEREEISIDNNNINNILSSNPVKEIVDYLNQATGKNFKATTGKTKKCISARLKEGFSVDDFKAVIDIKCKKWLKDDKMRDYLRPETLFGTKFEGYLNEAPQKKTVIPDPIEEQPQEEVLDIRTGYELLPQNEWTEDEIEDAVSKGTITEEEAHSILWG